MGHIRRLLHLWLLPSVLIILLATPGTAQEPASVNRLDPILRLALDRSTQLQEARARGEEIPLLDQSLGVMAAPVGLEVWVEVLVKGSGVDAAVQDAGGTVGSRHGRIVTARVPLSAVSILAESPGVEYVEASTENTIAMDAGLDSIGADVLHSGAYNYRGSGVLVAVYDTGLDYTHDDFRNGDGTTRVKSMWDQTDNSGTAPSGFTDGSEWSATQLNDELDGSPAGLVTQLDTHGHGTHVMGIAAGNGRATGNGEPDSVYVGVAPAADLLVIKGGNGSFSSADIIDGIAWTFAKADALAQPCVLNLSLGGHSGPHDGTMLYEEAIDIAVGTGKVIVISAGNEGDDALHDRSTLSVGTPSDSFSFTIPSYTPNSGTDNDYILCNIWYEGSTTVSVSLKDPYGSVHGPVATGSTYGVNTSQGYIYINNASGGTDARNGDYQCILQIYDAAEGMEPDTGSWTIIYGQDSGANTPVDMWFYGNTFGSTVDVPTSYRSTAHPGTANDAITVGAWVSKWGWDALDGGSYTYTGTNRTGNYALFSSWGPSRDGRQKPEIAAPGKGIMAAMSSHMTPPSDPWRDPDGVHRMSQGTSQAAPVVTGTTALLLEIDDTLNASAVKSLLQDNARTDGYTGSIPNVTWGYGKLDALATADALLVTANLPSIAIYQPTGVQSGNVTIPYVITDQDSSSVGLLAEYSVNSGGSWQAAAVSGDTSGIAKADYDSSLVWQSGSDFANQEADGVWFRITPNDVSGWGTADTTFIDIDNQAPQWIAAEGTSGDSTFTFWFNELVADSTASDTSNVSLSGGLIAESITGIDHDVWLTRAAMSDARHNPSAGVIDGKLYVVGGDQHTNILEVYDPITDSWTIKAPMPTARWFAGVGVIEGKLYVAGGSGEAGRLNSLEVYDPSTDTWTTRASIPTDKDCTEAAVIDGKLYVTDGSTLEVYDPSTDSWTTKTPIPSGRNRTVAGVIDGKLYIAGGGWPGVSNLLEVYDPSTESWTTLANMLTARHEAAGGVIDGKLYVAGGGGEAGLLNSLEVYDPSTDTWTTRSSMPSGSRMAAAGVIDDKLYVVGGDRSAVVVYTALPSQFELTLSGGQKLSSAEPPVTLTATGITDLNGNVAASLDTTFAPADLNRPSIGVYQPTGTRIGDVTLPYVISDPEGGPVGLLAEYSVDVGTSWLAATITGDTSDIVLADFDSSLVWQGGTDLSGQDVDTVWFRIVPYDAGGWGTADTTHIDIDNKPPDWIAAAGPGDHDTLNFWFNEAVIESSATNVDNYSFSGGLTVESIGSSDINTWTTTTSMPTAGRWGAAVGVINGKLYVAGGHQSGALEVYDPATDSWDTKTSMPTPRRTPADGVIDGKFYVVGGQRLDTNSTDVLEVYDPTTDSWITGLAPMPTARLGANAVAIDGKLYVVGGLGAGASKNTLEVYDPSIDSWTTKAPMPTARFEAASGVIDGKIYVVGGSVGSSELTTLEMYDPTTNSWTTGLEAMPTARWRATAGVVDGKLYVTGGELSGISLRNTEVYDPSDNSWSIMSYLPTAGWGVRSGVIDEKFFVTGSDGGGFDVYTALPSHFTLTLTGGQRLPSPETGVTLTASNITDMYGNSIAASLDTTFNSTESGQQPDITIYQPTGIQNGDVTIPYVIADSDTNLVSLLAEYSLDEGSSWQPAAVSSDTSKIAFADYDSSLVWTSNTDLTGQDAYSIWFRITPYDNGGWGTADFTLIDVDNKPPEWIAAEGVSGDTTFDFWFNEAVDESSSTNTDNYSLSGGLTAGGIISTDDNVWTARTSMPTARTLASGGVIDGKLYVAGGADGLNDGTILEVYDPSTDSWTTKTPMPTARYRTTAGVIDGKLYVLGGMWLSGHLRTLEVYDPAANNWTTKTPIPTTRADAMIDVVDGKLYVAGGDHGGPNYTDALEVYDPSTDEWTTKTSMPTIRTFPTGGVIDGKLYVVGGKDPGEVRLATLEVYDPSTDIWTTKTPMPTARSCAAAEVIDGKLYVAGGEDQGPPLATLEVYDPSTDTWTTKTLMLNAKNVEVAGVIEGKLYVVSSSNGDMEVYTALPSRFDLTLTSGQTLPGTSTPVTITASNISDLYGNTISASLDSTFYPEAQSSEFQPTVAVYQPTGVQSGDITIPFVISDQDSNSVGLLAEYSVNSGGSWQTAAVTGDTSGIAKADYDSSLVWNSGTDLPNQEADGVWFRITPNDVGGWGTVDTTFIDIDNQAPQWIAAEGTSGDSTLTFWFDELVADSTASNTSNISLSGGLTAESVRGSDDDVWNTKLSMPTSRFVDAATGVVNGILYVVGGNDGTILDALEAYDPTTDSWTLKASMPTAREGVAAAVINELLYVVGGYNGSTLTVLEVYNPSNNSWITKTSMNIARTAPISGVINGKLYILGGWDGSSYVGALEEYDPGTDSWTIKTSMPTTRANLVGGVINGKLYAASGQTTGSIRVDELEVYDPLTDSWTSKSSMTTARAHAAGTVINGKLYVAGGHSDQWLNILEVYDPQTDSWTVKSSSPIARGHAGAESISGKLYVIGGYNGILLNALEVYTALPSSFELTLSSGQTLPGTSTPVTITASNISDLVGNTISAPLDTTFNPEAPSSAFQPTVAVYQPTGVQSGNVTIPYVISDQDSNSVGLLTEYSINDGGSWQTAVVTGDTSSIAKADYDSSLVWNSGSDLSGQEVDAVWFRITPNDVGGWGTADTTFIDIDNKDPQWIVAEGTSGDSTFTFWFDELMADSAATDTSNFSLSGGLTAGSISGSDDDTWTTKTAMPTARAYAATGVISRKLYVVGGWDGSALSTLEEYDPSTDSWTTKTSMPTSRRSAAAGVIDGKLYVAGGSIDAGRLSTLEEYNPSTDTWTTKTSMPAARWIAAAGVINGKFYVAGNGVGGSTLEVYDPATDSWTIKTPISSIDTGGAGGVIDGRLYIAGGQQGAVELNTLVVYDPSTDSWTSKSPMTTVRNMLVAGVIDGKLYVTSGHDGVDRLNTLEVYDPSTNEWTTKTSMPTARYGAAAGVIGGKLYVVGGDDPHSTLEAYNALPSRFELTLSSGQKLSSTEPPITLTATSITDLNGNVAASLDTTFAPADLNRPSIGVYQPTGTQIGDVTLPYVISDPEGGPVGLLAEYSVDAGTTWLAATITGDTSDIAQADFDNSMVWHSVTDLADQEVAGVRFRITPHDPGGWGTASITHIDIDNQTPQRITAEGTSGDSTFSFWFDELVADSTATNVTNFSLSGGLTVGNIIGSDHDVWAAKASAPTSRLWAAADVIDSKLYVVGGNGALSTLEVYDPSTDSWTIKAPMPTGRALLAVGVIDGKLYAAGGSINWAIPPLEVYDPLTESWTTKTSMPTARYGAAGGVINGRLYVAGGNDGKDQLEVYDPVTDSWDTKAPMLTGRYQAAAGVIDGKLYVAGGESGGTDLATLEVYDPLTDSWTPKTDMPTARTDAAAGVIDGKLYVAGGILSGGHLNTLEVYDPITDSWTIKSYMLGARPWTTAGAIDGKLYIAGIWDGRLEVYTAIPSRFELTLTSGQTLSSAEPPVTLTATNIMDLHSNVAVSLDTTLTPVDPNRPAIALWQPAGTQSGDVTVPCTISDQEGSSVGLLAEYSLNNGGSWQAASVSSDTSGIALADYDTSLVWLSGTDLANQDVDQVWFRITPYDPGGWGTADITLIDIDNVAPQWIAASGTSGDATLTFWFDELINEVTATNTSNFSLSGGLTVGSIMGSGHDEWSTKNPMLTGRRGSAGGVIDGQLYVVGGWNGSGTLGTLEAYDPATDSWTTKTPMPTVRSGSAAGVIDGKLYVAGGGGLSKLEVYDPSTNSWTTKISMPNVGTGMVGGVIDGKLYVTGEAGVAEAWLHVYDPASGSWTTRTPMPTRRQNAAAGVIGGKFYVVGGEVPGVENLNTLEVYDPATDSWTTKTPMPTTRTDIAAGVIGGKFYVVGGAEQGTGYLTTLEVYDPATNNWTTLTPMNTIQNAAVAGVINGKLYMAGGVDDSNMNTVQEYTALPPRFELTLTGGQTLPFERITLQATGIQDVSGNPAGTLSTEFVPENDNDNPVISLGSIPDEVSGDVVITYTITDTEGDLIRLLPEYSLDGETIWLPATTSPDTTDIGPSGYDGSITWYTTTDLDSLDLQDVRFRITPTDNALETGQADVISLHVDNNEIPSAVITGTVYSDTDPTSTFNYQLSDTESDTLSLEVEYSTDAGGTWLPASTSSDTSSITVDSYAGSIVWENEQDLPGDVVVVHFRIVPRDIDKGVSAETTVQLDPLGVPSVTIDSTYTVEQNGDVLIPFTIVDNEGDLVSLTAEYLDTGDTWQTATVTGSITSLGPGSYVGTVTWNSQSDLDGQDMPDASFKLTPVDANPGFGDEVYFYLDNNDIPTISIGTPSSYQHRDVTFNYNISDTEGDAIGILALYSTDGGTSWAGMDVTGSDTTAIGSGNYTGTLTWHCFDDMGYGEWTNIMVKLLPHDLDAGTEGMSTAFTIENYVGDYSADGSVSSSDFATLIYAYNAQDSYHDIGPATGTVPLLMPVFDNVIDFEDLAVFIQMWNWSLGITAQQAEAERPGSLVKPTASERENQNHSVLLEEKIGDDPWATDNGVMDLGLKAQQVSGVMVTSVELTYDPEHLKFLSLEPGTFMGRPAGSRQSLIYLQNVNEEKGKLSLLLGRIDREDPDVSGSGLLASLHFVELSKENSQVTVAYEMWDRDAELLVQDSYQTEVQALRIPGEFALLQNYPNPFNGETVIRFQLPRAARVQMYVFNIRGQRVATLVDEQMDPGYHKITWDGRNDDNRKVASGIYIYLIQANRNRASQKLTIIK